MGKTGNKSMVPTPLPNIAQISFPPDNRGNNTFIRKNTAK